MKNERGAIDLLEESIGLLRSAPLSAHVMYLAGAVPFILALLYFFNDMTRSPFAGEHLATSALLLAALFIWKNVWQALFTARLYGTLSPGSGAGPNLFRLIFIVAALQPVSLIAPLPFPWLVAFFRNASLFAALGDPAPMRSAGRQAILWTRQNWAILSVVALAWLLIFLNAFALIWLLPQLARMFLGIEGEVVRSGAHIVNLTTTAVACAIAWMAVDPVLDAVYVLRCFYGESIATGEDLRAALRRAVAAAAMLIVVIIAVPRASAQSIDPAKLDRSIDQVIHRSEFTWRSPKAAGAEPEGRIASFVHAAADLVRRAWNYVKRLIDEWLRPKSEKEIRGGESPVTRRLMEALIGLVVAIIVGAAVAFFLRRRTPVVAATAVTAAVPAINLADDSVTADQLPEAGWLQLADEWLAKGDCRMALRALYLAGLNYLGRRGMVSIQRWKSGLDYRRELARRARSKPEISPVFSENVALFELAWYGKHPVNREMVDLFSAGLARIKAETER
jgi:hypothetical protein